MSLNLTDVNMTNGVKFNLNLQEVSFARIGWIEFINESPFTLIVAMGGMNFQIPAWDDYPKQIHVNVGGIWQALSSAQDPVSVTPQLIANNLISNMSTVLKVTLYTLGEYPPITVPRALFRQGYIPNQVNNVGGAATNIVNDGNIAGTSIVESTVAGDAVSAVTLTNDAQMNLGSALHPGALQLTGTGAFIKTPIIAGLGGDNIAIEAANGFATRFFSGGTFAAFIDANGINVNTGKLLLVQGTLARISNFSGTATNVSSSFNHGLGAVPDIVLLTLTGTNNTLSMVKYNTATLTSTTVDIVADSSRAFVGLAIKF